MIELKPLEASDFSRSWISCDFKPQRDLYPLIRGLMIINGRICCIVSNEYIQFCCRYNKDNTDPDSTRTAHISSVFKWAFGHESLYSGIEWHDVVVIGEEDSGYCRLTFPWVRASVSSKELRTWLKADFGKYRVVSERMSACGTSREIVVRISASWLTFMTMNGLKIEW